MAEFDYHSKTATFAEQSTFEKVRRLHQFDGSNGLNILDVGCGSGILDEELAALGHSVTGLDSHVPSGSASSYSALGAWRFIQTDINSAWPVDDGTFDLVICTDVPEHMYDPTHVLDEARRVLMPEGKLIFGVPNHFDIRQRLRQLSGKGIVHWDNVQYGHTAWDYGHIRFFTIKELEKQFADSGWHIDTRQLNFMGAGIIPGRFLPAFIKRALLKLWPGLFSGKFVYSLSLEPVREIKYILVAQTKKGM